MSAPPPVLRNRGTRSCGGVWPSPPRCQRGNRGFESHLDRFSGEELAGHPTSTTKARAPRGVRLAVQDARFSAWKTRVRIPHALLHLVVAQSGSAPRSDRGGRRFKSCRLDFRHRWAELAPHLFAGMVGAMLHPEAMGESGENVNRCRWRDSQGRGGRRCRHSGSEDSRQ